MNDTYACTTQDLWVDTPEGRLYAKRWLLEKGRVEHRAPIVLFHDSLGCVELWRDFPKRVALVTGRDVIAYDRLGFGQSDPHPGRLTKDFIHDEALVGFHHLRKALSLSDFVAFGHSVGGGMAVGCAAAHPEDCLALITESAQAFVEDRTITGIQEARLVFAQSGQLERLAKYHDDKAAWVLSAWIDSWLAPEFANWNLDDDLRHVTCPVLAIHGDQDEYGSIVHPKRIAGLAHGASTVLIMDDIGHVPHREKAEHVIQAVGQWLARSA